MGKDNNLDRIEVAGSYRRRQETVGDIDILVHSSDPEKTMDHFTSYDQVEKVLGHGDTKSSIWLRAKLQVDIRVVPEKSFGAALQYFTGNVDHNVKLRSIAISKGYKLSEYGEGKRVAGSREVEIYEKLGLQYPVPELRQDSGEIEAAIRNQLPELIELKDIKGDLQMHTTHSDGVNTIEEMALKAKSMGYEYIGITDHFGKLYVANAIEEKEFDDYLKDIHKADDKIDGIKIFASGEVEIGKDGELEFNKKKLQQLDYVIAAVHFSTKMPQEDMTKRLLTAIRDPLTNIIAHPTGRIIGQRPGFEFDYEKVFMAAKEENVAMEINASPMRIDLNDELARMAKDIGCKLVINTDAHSIEGLDDMHFGVNSARRSWVERNNLLDVKDIGLLV